MDYFVGQLQIVLPVLCVDAIRARELDAILPTRRDELVSPVFHLRQPRLGVEAQTQQVGGEFTVLAGSKCVARWHGTGKTDSTIKAYASYRAEHERLLAESSISPVDSVGVFTRDVVFGSPSTAGAICLGRWCDGRREWIGVDGTMFGAWESRGVL
ncbi:DUF4357 domain-containing protein [Aestuariimicrobium sp. T2.26MG-19.2B]|uniref:DUF4357 domain-containing protein n=1 Tax=Aestuariimicrobium sp. T2.26MG-19.2B TaxID=3040679 RepID=UPI002477BC1F|nr:DUF4357 domain-containing protein [Aestuariimicrobium sp. T2.26MG-19.2B]CAI9402692.1 hypothetical protein AESSP_00852 [Aestuariimicrobium sp. T2.26MG-19.2B]